MFDGSKRRNIQTYTSPQEVYAEYEEFCEAADVFGRPDLAAASRERVTPAFCAEHAAVSRVLRSCAGHPLKRKSPQFSRQEVVDNDALYDEIMREIPEPVMYNGGDTSSEAEEEGDDSTDTSSEHSDAEDTVDTGIETNAVIKRLASRYKIKQPVPLCPKSSSPSMFVKEAALLVTDQPCFAGQSVEGVSQTCSRSLWEQFGEYPVKKQSDNVLMADSVIHLLSKTEAASTGAETDPISPAEKASVETWLRGDITVWPFTAADSERWCVPVLLTPESYEACLYAVLARRVFNVAEVSVEPLSEVNHSLYALAIKQQWSRNGHTLLESGSRTSLLEAWHQLAGVYLAQDSRMSSFLDMCRDLEIQSFNSISDASSQSWPELESESRKDSRIVPVVSIASPKRLEQAFGKNFANSFDPEALEYAWSKIVNAFSRGNQHVEFEMAETAQQVKDLITSQVVPAQYFPL